MVCGNKLILKDVYDLIISLYIVLRRDISFLDLEINRFCLGVIEFIVNIVVSIGYFLKFWCYFMFSFYGYGFRLFNDRRYELLWCFWILFSWILNEFLVFFCWSTCFLVWFCGENVDVVLILDIYLSFCSVCILRWVVGVLEWIFFKFCLFKGFKFCVEDCGSIDFRCLEFCDGDW